MVAMNVWPTDAAEGSVATEARWRAMARYWQPSGVLVGQGGSLAPSLAYPNLTIQAGVAWVDGHYCELLGSQVLTVTANGLAVVRFDPAANTAELIYRDGATTPTQNPTGIFEIPIAVIAGSALTVDARALVDAGGGLVFGSTAARDLNLPTPPNGLSVQAPSGTFWTRAAGAWGRLLLPTKIYVGSTPGGNVPPGNGIVTASITGLPLGWYRITYTVLVSSGAAVKGNIRILGAMLPLIVQFNSGAMTETWHMDVLAEVVGAGTVTMNVDNTGTATLSTYSDSANHQLWATPVQP